MACARKFYWPLSIVCASRLLCWQGIGAEIDKSKLPPPAGITTDFQRDINPIFEASCFRCHGAERPKSDFRLTDREAALKGGANGLDIIPGNSADSPLIHYVALLVPDMEMPPDGKGDPLTPAQVGLLRAWIDQGAQWGATSQEMQFSLSAAPTLGWILVRGDEHKFREVEGIRDSAYGGIEEFTFQQNMGQGRRLTLDGRLIAPNEDFQLKLELRKSDLGFVRAGVEQWRKYYDDSGGFYRPFSPPAFELNQDLHLDIGRAWVDFGLTIPRLPQITIGYEHQYREGSKSTLAWGNVGGKSIYPASKEIDEDTHIAKFDLTYEFLGFSLEDNARVEFHDLSTRDNNPGIYTTGPGPDSIVHTRQTSSYVQGMNTLYLERQVIDQWLISGGYLYSRLDGDASLNQFTLNSLGVPTSGSFWSAETTLLERESQILSLANLFLPVNWLSASLGLQSEWTRQNSLGRVNLDEGDPNFPGSFQLYPASVESSLDTQKTSENLSLRFTAIPWTILFAEGRLDQQRMGQFEQDVPQAGTTPDPSTTFLRDTDFSNHRQEFRAGFSTSPWGWASLNAHYRVRLSDSDYDNTKIALDPAGYSAFIRERTLDTEEIEARLVLRPLSWLRTTLTCQLLSTDFNTTTDPVPGAATPSRLLAGNYDAHNYGLSATVTPIQNLYVSGSFTYGNSRISTLQVAEPAVVPYEGDVYSCYGSASYALNNMTQFQVAYSFSTADYGQDNIIGGLPMGLNYARHGLTVGITRRFSKFITARLGYGFFKYSEPSAGGFNDYTAHGVFATMVMKLP